MNQLLQGSMKQPKKTSTFTSVLSSFQQAETTTKKPKKIMLKHKNKQNSELTSINSNHTKSLLTFDHNHSINSIDRTCSRHNDSALKELSTNRDGGVRKYSCHAYNKFVAQITRIIVGVAKDRPPQVLYRKIGYIDFLSILKQAKMVPSHYQPSPSDLVTSLWNQTTSHTFGNFIILLASIMNLTQQSSPLTHKYQQLRFTRYQYMGKTKTMVTEQSQHSFAPYISPRSKTLAASKSKSKSRKKCQHFKKIESPKKSIQFKRSANLMVGNKRSEILYQLAKQKSQEKRKDKKRIDIDYEKSIDQLTFKPKIHLNNRDKPKNNVQGQEGSINRMIKGRVDKEVKKIITEKGLPYNQRVVEKLRREVLEQLAREKEEKEEEKEREERQCREEREEKERRECENQSVFMPEKSDREKPQEKMSQKLVLTIQVGEGRNEKLVIHENESYQEAASRFISQFNLNEQMSNKLIKGLQTALKFQLTRIDQISFQQQYE